MDTNKLKRLLKQEEGPKLDFKAALRLTTESERKELTKDVIAVANSRGGRGYLVFGVEDKTKRILGVERGDFKEEQIQQIIYNRCDPPVPISVDFVEYECKLLCVITIYRSYHQPHQMLHNGSFYIRRGSTTDTARRGEIANLMQENGLLTYETVILQNVSVEELDFDLVSRYFKNLDVISDKPSSVLLSAMGILGQKNDSGDYSPTIGGLLLFGRNPSLFLPHVYVKVMIGTEARCFFGSLLGQLDGAMAYLRRKVKDKGYPMDALEETVANAIAHRDYLDNSRGINIIVSDKNIEVSNPGAFTAYNSVYKFMKERNPDRRNAWLYQRLLTLDHKRRFMKSGMGLVRIKKAFADLGEVKFLNIGTQNLFKVILPRRTGDVRQGKGGGGSGKQDHKS